MLHKLKERTNITTSKQNTQTSENDMKKLTIKTRNETYVVDAAIEFAGNFIRHILNGEAASVTDENGKLIGGNAGKAGGLQGWYIKHPLVKNTEIKNAILHNVSVFGARF